MKDTARNGQVALLLIMAFEIFMLGSWILNVSDKTTFKSLGYLVLYLFLLTLSFVTFIYLHAAKKNIDKNYRTIDKVQHFYAFAILAWATGFTYIGSTYGNSFDYLIFITIVTIVPLFCYLNPVFWIIVQLIGTGFMMYFASHYDHFFAFQVNFSVFTIISMLAGLVIHRQRRILYQKQIELEEEKNIAFELAHQDTLTGLPNRQSYIEELEHLSFGVLPQDLVIAVFDVNGLKAVNDSLGHEAGDELLKGTAHCLQQAFSGFGKVYRVGGDEYAGILYVSDQQLVEAVEHFKQITAGWQGTKAKSLSVSVGCASVREHSSDTLTSLVTKADNAMYEDKRNYYNNK